MSEKDDLKKKFEKRSHDKSKRKPKEKKDKALVRTIGQYEVDFDQSLGKGQFGNVYRACIAANPQKVYACKHISEKRLSSDYNYEENTIGKTIRDRLMDEIKTHQSLGNCDHIVQLIEFKYQNDGYYLFMDMCDTDLGKRLKMVQTFKEAEAMNYMKQLLKGYKHLFDRNISHRDLKPENLLLKDEQLMIADFGFVKISEDIDLITKSQQRSQFMAESVVGSINYIAPDVLRSESKGIKYNPYKSDVWSMGIILFKMLFGREPYRAASKSELLEQIETQELRFPEDKKVSPKVVELMQKMIQKDEKQRLDFMALYELVLEGDERSDKEKTPKQIELQFYNQLMTRISYDSANHATFREIGIAEYQKFSSQLMTLIHERRDKVLNQNADEDVDERIKNQMAYYSNNFYYAIKETAEIEKEEDGEDSNKMLLRLLTLFRNKLAAYSEFEMLHKNIQFFLLLLLQLYHFEKKSVTIGFISTIIQKERSNKMTLVSLEKIRQTSLMNELAK